VVKPLTALRQKAPDAVVRIERLQQLDLRIAGTQQRRAHALVGNFSFAQQGQSQRASIERIGVAQTFHHDTDVMNPEHHGRILL